MTGDTYRAITSTLTPAGKLELALVVLPMPQPRENQVLIRIEATPINPSDIGALIGPGDVSTIVAGGVNGEPRIVMDVSKAAATAAQARVGRAMQVGNEGAGIVVDAGAGARGLIGKTVAVSGGRMLAEYRCLDAAHCLVFAADVSPAEAAGAHTNPVSALGMIETMRRENHDALVHTAAASNLGQMLVKICRADNVPLVNIVRRPEQASLLKALGAAYVCDSSAPAFRADLGAALSATGARIAFDATGGGSLASDILTAMEQALAARGAPATPYGTALAKKVYIYGGLDRGPLILNRSFGMSWAVAGWIMSTDQAGGPERYEALRQRVAREIKTNFASHYGKEISLAGVLEPDAIRGFTKQSTGEKYLVRPQM
jgi:NADPH:quinone reductase-like Zn-dependent oxidoreductase